jgi:probable HAF family extracellular repeat protein
MLQSNLTAKTPFLTVCVNRHFKALPKAVLLLITVTSLTMIRLDTASAQAKFLVTDLGANSTADGINNRGDVVGTYTPPGTAPRAFIYKQGRITYLTTPPTDHGSTASGINNRDEVIGESQVVQDPRRAPTENSFLYEANGTRVTIAQSQGPVYPQAYGINTPGTVVGFYDAGVVGPLQHAFLYRSGQLQDIGALLGPGFNDARAINNAGQVVGTADNQKEAFLYSNGRAQLIGNFIPNSINDHGQITGTAFNSTQTVYTAILYTGGLLQNLGTLPGFTNSEGLAINNRGEIVGVCSNSTGNGVFLYTSGQMRDLSELVLGNWVITDSSGINDRSEIAATGTQPGSVVTHALLLTPLPFSGLLR